MRDLDFLKNAVGQAENSVKEGGFPAGAIVVKDNKIVSKGISVGYILHDPTSHAETASIRSACGKFKTTDLSGATLYASLQPCLMCFSVANWARITRIVYGCKKTEDMIGKNYYEGKTDIEKVNSQNNRQIELVYIPDFEQEMLNLVKSWEVKNNV
jgi:tRNA(Arg) A34 adenosine deaminase TadA